MRTQLKKDTNFVYLYNEPNTKSKVVRTLYPPMTVEVVEDSEKKGFVKLSKPTFGWIQKDSLVG